MNLNKKINDACIRIGPVRFSYVNVHKPRADKNGNENYSCCVIIDKDNDDAIDLIMDAIENVKKQGKSTKWDGKIPANLKTPLRDGDEERDDDDAFANSYFFNCKSHNKPGVAVKDNGTVTPVFDESEFYSGCYGAITVNFYPYNSNGNRGIGVGLQNVIKLKDGERLSGGGASAEEDFDDLND